MICRPFAAVACRAGLWQLPISPIKHPFAQRPAPANKSSMQPLPSVGLAANQLRSAACTSRLASMLAPCPKRCSVSRRMPERILAPRRPLLPARLILTVFFDVPDSYRAKLPARLASSAYPQVARLNPAIFCVGFLTARTMRCELGLLNASKKGECVAIFGCK
jgi:hypothetical protein